MSLDLDTNNVNTTGASLLPSTYLFPSTAVYDWIE
jgi:hypothetical protein